MGENQKTNKDAEQIIAELDAMIEDTRRPSCIKPDCLNHKPETRDWDTIIRRGFYFNKAQNKKLQRFQCTLCGSILRFEEHSPTKTVRKDATLPHKILNDWKEPKSQKQLAKDFNVSHKTLMEVLDEVADYLEESWLVTRATKQPEDFFVIELNVGRKTKFHHTVFFSFNVVSGMIDGVEVAPFADSEGRVRQIKELMFTLYKDTATYKIIGPNSYEGFDSVQSTHETEINLKVFDALEFDKWQSFKSEHEVRQKMILFALVHNNHIKHLKKTASKVA
ncbi:MAG: hypothetical protein AAGB31_12320 [Bdellovibrio sp.]